MLKTVGAVYIYIYIVRFNEKVEINNIVKVKNRIKEAMCFRGT